MPSFNPQIEAIVRLALAEDLGHGDLTTELTVTQGQKATAAIKAKETLVVSGLVPARLAFALTDPAVLFDALVEDGQEATPGQELVRLTGSAHAILVAERTALNFMMRLSGVATLTRKFVRLAGENVRLVDTRKTAPGQRALEKAAVRHGGAFNHRFGLHDGILIKENHIAAAGSIPLAVGRARAKAPHTLKVEVEVEDLEGLEEAIKAGADLVLLDNMDNQTLAKAVALAQGRVTIEASGGVTLETVAAIASTGVDIISVGALTHSAPAVDISLNLVAGEAC